MSMTGFMIMWRGLQRQRETARRFYRAHSRGSIAVLAIAKAEAFLRGHTYVLPSDIQYVLMDAAAHRIIVDNGLRNGNVTAETALKNVLETVSVPKLDVKRVV